MIDHPVLRSISLSRSTLLCLSVAVGLLGPGCSDDDPTAVDLDFAAFDDVISTYLDDQGLAGAGAVVVDRDDGELHVQGYGAFDAGRLYLIASSSKILSVGVLMRLADEGMVDVDEPIGTYLSDAFGDGKPELTLAQLLSNSSGLVGLTDNPTYLPYLCQYLSAGTLTDCAQAIYVADDAADRAAPDTEFHYGGGQWQLAGGIAEVVSGQSWADLIAETYAAPCGADSLGYGNEFEKSAFDYPPDFDGVVANLTRTDNPSIEGGAYITVADYGKLLLMHLRDGQCGQTRALSEQAARRMRVDRIGEVYGGTTGFEGALQGYGLGWWIDREHEGVFMDPGAYGAIPWLDLPRGYGAFIAIEGAATQGAELVNLAKPALDAIMDAR